MGQSDCSIFRINTAEERENLIETHIVLNENKQQEIFSDRKKYACCEEIISGAGGAPVHRAQSK